MASTLEIARAYVASGLSVVPIRADGSKAAAVGWKEFQQRLATDAELVQWFESTGYGIAIVCGAISGGLEVLDFDDLGAFEAWWNRVAKNRPELLPRCCIVATPDDGRHVYMRLPRHVAGNRKLVTEAKSTRSETRGEGGYVLAPGCPGACHPSGKTYQHISGPDLTELIPF